MAHMGDSCRVPIRGVIKGDTRSLDYSSDPATGNSNLPQECTRPIKLYMV